MGQSNKYKTEIDTIGSITGTVYYKIIDQYGKVLGQGLTKRACERALEQLATEIKNFT